ncbi:MAG: acyltransferase [Sphingopyxis sp.]|uniref:acyltransferase family protein n=1 Tax=Sphingopyxis sp. TaxID=1908224 RepID=UPI002ABC28E1|nr:acyltransferase [Sphingopyxis sp.]MDZ3833682.1 acyltransferase [Sphingopyxis sp.]
MPSHPKKSGGDKLRLIEVGRGAAALAVAIFHANASSRHMGGPFYPGLGVFEHGVDFFFVISGFIIYVAHAGGTRGAAATKDYLRRRALRIFPTLWLIVAGWALLRVVVGEPPDAATFTRSMLPYPSLEPTLPLVVWTLRFELLFYAVFAIFMFQPRFGLTAFAIWSLAVIVQMALIYSGHGLTGRASFFLSAYVLDFMIGMGVAFLYRTFAFRPSLGPLFVALCLLALSLYLLRQSGAARVSFADYVSAPAAFGTLALGLLFAFVVYGLLAAERAVAPPAWMVRLGGMSYALYLIHTPVNAVVQHLLPFLPAEALRWGAGHVLLVTAGVLAAAIFHDRVERPLARHLDRLTAPRREGGLR